MTIQWRVNLMFPRGPPGKHKEEFSRVCIAKTVNRFRKPSWCNDSQRVIRPKPLAGWMAEPHFPIGIGERVTPPPLPHHQDMRVRIRRFGGLS